MSEQVLCEADGYHHPDFTRNGAERISYRTRR
jgi:hypothetical protein